MIKLLPTLLLFFLIICGCGRGDSTPKKTSGTAAAQDNAAAVIAEAAPNAQPTGPATRLDRIDQSAADELTLHYANGTGVIFSCQGTCESLLSPNRSALALNTAILSNHSITTIYRLGPDGKVDFSQAENLSAKVWSLIGMMHDIEVADVLQPRTAAMGWDSDTVIEVLVTGETETGLVIDEVVRVEVE